MRVSRRSWLVVVVGAVILAAPMIDDAVARKQRSRFSAMVDGKRLKGWKRATFATYATTGFGVIASARPRRGVVRSLSVDCVGVDLRTITLPVFWPDFSSMPECFGFYLETRLRGGLKQWTSAGMEVTVDSFDGTRVVGTFRGIIQPSTSNPSEPAVTVEGGRFSVFVRDAGV